MELKKHLRVKERINPQGRYMGPARNEVEGIFGAEECA